MITEKNSYICYQEQISVGIDAAGVQNRGVCYDPHNLPVGNTYN